MAARKTPSKGAKPDKIWSDALRRAVFRKSDTDKGKKRIEVMADKCARMAESGDMAAIREIGDRLDGKSPQYSEIAGAGGAPLTLVVETGVPARAMVDITPGSTDSIPIVTHGVTRDDDGNGKNNGVNGLDNEST